MATAVKENTASVSTAEHLLLDQVELQLQDLEDTLGLLHAHDIDFGDVYLQYMASESWVLEDGIVKEGSFSIDKGVGDASLARGEWLAVFRKEFVFVRSSVGRVDILAEVILRFG